MNFLNQKNNKKGFTLIELLVVIVIVALIVSLAVLSLGKSRASVRDAKRLSDVKKVQTALEVFRVENGHYPDASSIIETGSIAVGGKIYLAEFPKAPEKPDGGCSAYDNQYIYSNLGENNGSYTLSFCLGDNTDNFSAGSYNITPSGIFKKEKIYCEETIEDYDRNVYNTVIIGDQCWMKENLKTTKYNNGVEIPNLVRDGEWSSDRYGAFCWYNNNIENKDSFGGLYNWFAINNNNKICPTGWHVPSNNEWIELFRYVIGDPYCDISQGCSPAAMYLKNGSSFNDDGRDLFGLNVMSTGIRFVGGGFGDQTRFWTSTQQDEGMAFYYRFGSYISGFTQHDIYKESGFSVRCVKD